MGRTVPTFVQLIQEAAEHCLLKQLRGTIRTGDVVRHDWRATKYEGFLRCGLRGHFFF
jgi:hypothetical protein